MLKVTNRLRRWIQNKTGMLLPSRVVNLIFVFLVLLVVLVAVATHHLIYTNASIDDDVNEEAIMEMMQEGRMR